MPTEPSRATALLATAREGRAEAALRTDAARTELPLRYLRQQAHLTAPASDFKLAEKALSGAYVTARRLLDRYEIGAADLAEHLGVDLDAVNLVLAERGAPLVLIDLEDGVAPSMVAAARENAIRLVRDVDRGATLCYLRTVGVTDPRCADDLVELLTGAGAGLPADAYPVDGIVLPKVRHVHEVEWVDSVLSAVERELGLATNRIRVTFQVETGWGVLNLPALVAAGLPRLSGIVLGTVDLGADVLLPEVRYRHPVAEWARSMIVLAAGGAGVPAIDGMTLDFPVGLPDLSAAQNRQRVLQRMGANFTDALHSIDYGMAGRWVGHPLQLVATALAFRHAFSAASLDEHVATVERFAQTVTDDRGAAAGAAGELLDIGTDRHLRRVLRRAAAWGMLSPQRARELGLVAPRDMEAPAP